MSLRAHHRPVAEVLEQLGTSSAGLAPDEVLRRRAEHGLNVLDEAPPRSMLALFLAQFADFMILVLLAAAVCRGCIGNLTDTLVIVAIVLLNAAIGFGQEFRAAKAMEALKAMAAPSAMVVRAGAARVGAGGGTGARRRGAAGGRADRAGGSASRRGGESAHRRGGADRRVGAGRQVDEALGDPELAVGDRRNIAHKGTQVTYGRGLGVVVATGMRTEFGRIARLLESAHAVETPLQRRLAVFGRRLALVVIGICVVVFATGLLRGEPALPMLLTALSLAVAAIPEALPAVVTISLALGARRLMARAGADPAARGGRGLGFGHGDLLGQDGHVDGERDAGRALVVRRRPPMHRARASRGRLLLSAMAVSHDASWARTAVDGRPDRGGDAARGARGGAGPRGGARAIAALDEVPFDSARKCMTTIHRLPEGGLLAVTKGAAEVVLAASVSVRRGAGRARARMRSR